MMRKLGPLALVGAVAITVAACGPPGTTRYVDRIFATAPATTGVRYATAPDLVTGAPVDLRLHAFQPGGDTAASRPALIWVHGGGFMAGDRTSTNQIATEYAQRGYVTFSIDYRLDPGNRCAELQAGTITNPAEKTRETARCRAAIVAAQHDAQAVVRWVRANAAAYRVDPGRIAMGGFSAREVRAAALPARPPGE